MLGVQTQSLTQPWNNIGIVKYCLLWNEWMNEWMNGRTDGRTNQPTNQPTNKSASQPPNHPKDPHKHLISLSVTVTKGYCLPDCDGAQQKNSCDIIQESWDDCSKYTENCNQRPRLPFCNDVSLKKCKDRALTWIIVVSQHKMVYRKMTWYVRITVFKALSFWHVTIKSIENAFT